MDFSDIALIIYDCDGVLTDNRVLVDETGRESVFFHRGDGYGVSMIKELGIRQAILSTETSPVVLRRAEKLKIDAIHGVTNKKILLLEYCVQYGISTENTSLSAMTSTTGRRCYPWQCAAALLMQSLKFAKFATGLPKKREGTE